ncbi:hypothetical protein BU14_0027s0133 [Porphyra umbilicalis]|uniref:Uncharacterized protein n=1 Tax=Porphyra umbilicalis TaxID=2786 RepID=A0A1X6PJU5_PORUM|nr:hypothetical protein BU14_0027s0133 [Porphyra umbilicalis]|eukprot:OSX81111.1 hypothetical protein BU14_0027s0133 [Porphyra umbilicalis]
MRRGAESRPPRAGLPRRPQRRRKQWLLPAPPLAESFGVCPRVVHAGRARTSRVGAHLSGPPGGVRYGARGAVAPRGPPPHPPRCRRHGKSVPSLQRRRRHPRRRRPRAAPPRALPPSCRRRRCAMAATRRRRRRGRAPRPHPVARVWAAGAGGGPPTGSVATARGGVPPPPAAAPPPPPPPWRRRVPSPCAPSASTWCPPLPSCPPPRVATAFAASACGGVGRRRLPTGLPTRAAPTPRAARGRPTPCSPPPSTRQRRRGWWRCAGWRRPPGTWSRGGTAARTSRSAAPGGSPPLAARR